MRRKGLQPKDLPKASAPVPDLATAPATAPAHPVANSTALVLREGIRTVHVPLAVRWQDLARLDGMTQDLAPLGVTSMAPGPPGLISPARVLPVAKWAVLGPRVEMTRARGPLVEMALVLVPPEENMVTLVL